VDKYRPKDLSKLDYHKEQAAHLKKLIDGGDFPHLLVSGPSGAGKKTRIMALLRQMYGPGVEKLRIENHTVETPSKKKLEVVTVASNYHMELNPSDVGIYDRCVIQQMIKTVASTHQLDSSGQREFKVIILTESDKLSKDAQHALRRTMEKYSATCRLVLCANSTSKIIPAIRSRCLNVRVSAPTNEEIVGVLQLVCKKEGLNLPSQLAEKIAEKSRRNLRRALLMTETCKVENYPFSDSQTIPLPDWEVFVTETASLILAEQSPNRLYEVRKRLYELLSHCVPPESIFKGLLRELLRNVDGELKPMLVALTAYHEHRLNQGSKQIYHLEAFVASFMSIYKQFLEEAMNDDMF